MLTVTPRVALSLLLSKTTRTMCFKYHLNVAKNYLVNVYRLANAHTSRLAKEEGGEGEHDTGQRETDEKDGKRKDEGVWSLREGVEG